MRPFTPTLGIALAIALGAPALASPAKQHGPDLSKVHTPGRQLHAEYVVEVNKLGQITKVDDVKKSGDHPFDAMTYGNTLQAFIRTRDGKAVVGKYRMVYDYNPQTKNVRRTVALVQKGGVNPNALGAVSVEAQKLAREHEKQVESAQNAQGQLPSIHQITRHPRH